jgi:hypothetical protein
MGGCGHPTIMKDGFLTETTMKMGGLQTPCLDGRSLFDFSWSNGKSHHLPKIRNQLCANLCDH